MIYDLNDLAEDPSAYAAAIDRAVGAIRDGRLVVLPTDTVYGIAADAFSAAAVGELLAAKGRGRDYPVPVLIGNPGVLAGLVVTPPPAAQALADRFWPGPLTLVVRHSPTLAWDLGETGGTVAVRMPADRGALDLLEKTGPLAVSSANRHGEAPATTATEASRQFGEDVAVYLESGPTTNAEPSTIVDCTGAEPVVLRAGALTVEELATVIPSLASGAESD